MNGPAVCNFEMMSPNSAAMCTENFQNETISIKASSKVSKTKFQVNKTNCQKEQCTKNETKPKVKISFFKDFSVKFTKRENIDKKVLRKFRKFLKDNNKKIAQELAGKLFWNKFIQDNLLPPMKYQPENVEYKSFNTNYMVWLMSHKGAVELYEKFISEHFEEILSMFIGKFNLKEGEELQQLRHYIKNLASIFNSATNNESTECNVQCCTTITIKEEETYTHVSNEKQIIQQQNNTPVITNMVDSYNCFISENYNYNYNVNAEEQCNNYNCQMNEFTPINNNFDIFEEVISSSKGVKFGNFENCFEAGSDDLGKMFNNSFDDGYIFCDE